VREPVIRPVGHPYTDAPTEGIKARCYTFDEVFGEKIRALAERSRPRDLYDVINLFRNGELAAAANAVREVVKRKCAFTRVRAPQTGPTYVFRCTVCGKEFDRKTYDGTLRPHKNRGGQNCYGRFGTYMRTKY
jgi:tRNA(Ile2) C34 agmatinyltransferase TiaS